MQPPREIVVGPHRYKVVLVPDGVLDDAGRFGHASVQRLVIALDDAAPRSSMAATLLHELVHALLDVVELDTDVEERIALALGPALLLLLRENPLLVDYLTEEG